MSVDVVVPLQGDCPHRRAAWEWVRERYACQYPDWRMCLAEGVRSHAGDQDRASNGVTASRFSKGALVNPAVEASDAEIVIVADADCWTDGLSAAADAVKDGAPFAVPHDEVHRLSEAGTAAVLAGADWRGQALDQPPYQGLVGGGVVVARRETFLEVPFDCLFVGWGQEDAALGMALFHLVGQPWRGAAPLVHLFHPHPQRLSRKRGSVEGWNRHRLYVRARAYPEEMRRLVEEGRCPSPN